LKRREFIRKLEADGCEAWCIRFILDSDAQERRGGGMLHLVIPQSPSIS